MHFPKHDMVFQLCDAHIGTLCKILFLRCFENHGRVRNAQVLQHQKYPCLILTLLCTMFMASDK